MKPIRVPPRTIVATSSGAVHPGLEPGNSLACTVTGNRGNDVLVRFLNGEGVISGSEFTTPPAAGMKLAAWVWVQDADDGTVFLSTRAPIAQIDWERLQPGDLVEGLVVEVGTSGIRLDIQGVRGFIPTARLERGLAVAALLRKNLRAEVLDWNSKKKELLLARTRVLDERRQRRQTERYARFQRGESLEGTVVRVNDHGAFVDLGGVDGLLHVSKIERRKEELGDQPLTIEPGSRLRVEVLNVDTDRGRIGLGFPREVAPVTNRRITEEYKIGEAVMGLVQHVDHQGAHVMLDEGVIGVVPPAAYATWDEPLRRGNVVRATVASIDSRTQRIELQPNPPRA